MRNPHQIDCAAAAIAKHSPVDAELFRSLIDEGNEANRAAWDAWRAAWDAWRAAWDVYHCFYPKTVKSKAKPAGGSDLA